MELEKLRESVKYLKPLGEEVKESELNNELTKQIMNDLNNDTFAS